MNYFNLFNKVIPFYLHFYILISELKVKLIIEVINIVLLISQRSGLTLKNVFILFFFYRKFIS